MKKIITICLILLLTIFYPASTLATTLTLLDGEEALRTEQLPYYKKSPTSLVEITNLRKVIKKDNYIPVVYMNDISTKKLNCEENIQFVLPAGITTVEGTMLLPPNTIIMASVQQLTPPRAFNRNARLYLQFNQVLLPTDTSLRFSATPATADKALARTKLQAALKAAGWVVGGFGVGAGLGAAIGAAASAAWTGCWMGMAIGGGVGVIVAVVTPGLHYKAKKGDVIYIQLQEDFSIPNS